MVTPLQRHRARRSERGATVIVIVLTTTMIAAIGVFAVRNAAQVDLAVGYSRQAAQTMAVAELGTTAALAQVAVQGAPYYVEKMNAGLTCASNPPSAVLTGALKDAVMTCYPLGRGELEKTTAAKLFEDPASATGETGSFGPFSGMQGTVNVELTAMTQTNAPVRGVKQGDGTYYDVTMTTTGNVRPTNASADECSGNAPRATVKKMMRAHTVIGPLASSSSN
jgi:hypothetical protein